MKDLPTPSITLLVGMIASGKSTYASVRAAMYGDIVVNDDAMVMALHAGHYDLYNPSLKLLYKQMAIVAATTAIAMGHCVIIDALNHRVDTRTRWVSLARSIDVPINAVIFPRDRPAVHADRRHASDSRGLTYDHWFRAATAHAAEFQTVLPNEGFNRIISEKPFTVSTH